MNKLTDVITVPAQKKSLPTTSKGQVTSLDEYKRLYDQSINDPEKFYGEMATSLLDWAKPFTKVVSDVNNFADPPTWFVNGKLNACYNAVDRHAHADPNRVALIYEADEPGQGYKVTYGELLTRVCQTALLLESMGVKKGDIVTVYLPTIPETIYILLAIIRIGAVHSVVFAGFSPSSLADRIKDANSTIVVTTDQATRAGKIVETKKLLDEALESCPDVDRVLVVERTGKCDIVEGRDIKYKEEVVKFGNYVAPVNVDSEHPLFLLYTSGSTGKPKGLQQSTAGYLFGTILCNRHVFGVSPGDVFFTAADVGWVTGHSHLLYGPLLNGVTTVVYESTPIYPSHTRLWDIVDEHKVTQLYLAPTAIRLLRKYGHGDIEKYDLSSLRVLGSVGEPIARDVWQWYFDHVGRKRCSICDTYWLTESAMILLTSIHGLTDMKPGSAGVPFFGIKPVILTPEGKEITERPAEGILAVKGAWPSLARTVRNDHARFRETYLKPFPGYFFTGDGAAIDKDGYVFIGGRVDDVVNVSGHRLSTAEIEGALLQGRAEGHGVVAESAVVGVEDSVTGQALIAFIVLESWVAKSKKISNETVVKEAVAIVRKSIGPFAAPKKIFVVSDLPKTRSGKIMRRVLRKIVAGEQDQLGELSTLNNPAIIDELVKAVKDQSPENEQRAKL